MFFNSLYIERDEEKQLLEWRTTKWCSIVSGYLGSGKTTLLLKLIRHSQTKKRKQIYLFILISLKNFATLDEYDNSLIQEENNGEMYQQKMKIILFVL